MAAATKRWNTFFCTTYPIIMDINSEMDMDLNYCMLLVQFQRKCILIMSMT